MIVRIFIIFMVLGIGSLTSCKKQSEINRELPVVRIDSLVKKDPNDLLYYGHVSHSFKEAIVERGLCWSDDNQLPTLEDNFERTGTTADTGRYKGLIENLTISETYYFRGYTTTVYDTVYSEVMEFNMGAGWRSLPLNINSSFGGFSTMAFRSPHKLVAAGSYGVYYTSNDGGQIWSDNSLAIDQFVRDIVFASESIGYMIIEEGGDDRIMKTTDGGENWYELAYSQANQLGILYHLGCYGTDIVYVYSSNGDIIRSVNGGASWVSNNFAPGSIGAIHFYTSNTAFILTVGGQVYRTDNAGGNSNLLGTLPEGQHPRAIHFMSQTEGIAGSRGKLYKTYDGGATWSVVYDHLGNEFVIALDFYDDKVGVCSVGNEIIRTDDGGETWTKEWLPNSFYMPQILTLKLFDRDFGYAGHSSGALIYW